MINEKYYIGCHQTKNIDDKYMGSGELIKTAIKKHGKKNFKKEILFICKNEKEMYEKERELVTAELVRSNKSYNMKIGGTGGFTREMKARWHYKYRYEKGFAEKFKEHGRKNLEKIHSSGEHNYATFKGKTHSEETKELMSLKKKGKGLAENNSQYGTMWITHEIEQINKKIKKDEFEEYSKNGWIKGRKIKK